MLKQGPKLLLVDANNMSHRVFWTHKDLQFEGTFTGVLFGFIKQLISLKKQYPDHFLVIIWDGGYYRRRAESMAAVEAGIIPSAYKEPREKAKKDADPEKQEKSESLRYQMLQLKEEILPLIRCLQVYKYGFEGDDLIYTYCDYVHKWGGEAVVVSSDKDFYQTLGFGPEIKIYDAMTSQTITVERFELEFGYSPKLFVDYGALVGESGVTSDNIFGVDGWGKVTANKYVKEFGNLDNIIKCVSEKQVKSKKELKLLESIPRVRLAKSLKQMDIVPNLPRPKCEPKDSELVYKKWLE